MKESLAKAEAGDNWVYKKNDLRLNAYDDWYFKESRHEYLHV